MSEERQPTDPLDTRQALWLAAKALRGDFPTSMNHRERAALTLERILHQRGCADLGEYDIDKLPELIDQLVFG